MHVLGIIPARYSSKRLPGKPLAMIGDKPMIQWVYERASMALPEVVVATDDVRIIHVVEGFGGRAVLTSGNHKSGTSRVSEAASLLGTRADVVINIQGDEPFLMPEHIKALVHCFDGRADVDIATLVRRFNPDLGIEALADQNLPKVVIDDRGFAMYFTRSIIPYVRNVPMHQWLQHAVFHTHIGIYGYRREVLPALAALTEGPLQRAESLEQLNWLQAGYRIFAAEVDGDTIGVDTEADLERARRMILTQKLDNDNA